MEELLKFINSLEIQSFVGWTSEEKAGYLTALITIEEKILEINGRPKTK